MSYFLLSYLSILLLQNHYIQKYGTTCVKHVVNGLNNSVEIASFTVCCHFILQITLDKITSQNYREY